MLPITWFMLYRIATAAAAAANEEKRTLPLLASRPGHAGTAPSSRSPVWLNALRTLRSSPMIQTCHVPWCGPHGISASIAQITQHCECVCAWGYAGLLCRDHVMNLMSSDDATTTIAGVANGNVKLFVDIDNDEGDGSVRGNQRAAPPTLAKDPHDAAAMADLAWKLASEGVIVPPISPASEDILLGGAAPMTIGSAELLEARQSWAKRWEEFLVANASRQGDANALDASAGAAARRQQRRRASARRNAEAVVAGDGGAPVEPSSSAMGDEVGEDGDRRLGVRPLSKAVTDCVKSASDYFGSHSSTEEFRTDKALDFFWDLFLPYLQPGCSEAAPHRGGGPNGDRGSSSLTMLHFFIDVGANAGEFLSRLTGSFFPQSGLSGGLCKQEAEAVALLIESNPVNTAILRHNIRRTILSPPPPPAAARRRKGDGRTATTLPVAIANATSRLALVDNRLARLPSLGVDVAPVPLWSHRIQRPHDGGEIGGIMPRRGTLIIREAAAYHVNAEHVPFAIASQLNRRSRKGNERGSLDVLGVHRQHDISASTVLVRADRVDDLVFRLVANYDLIDRAATSVGERRHGKEDRDAESTTTVIAANDDRHTAGSGRGQNDSGKLLAMPFRDRRSAPFAPPSGKRRYDFTVPVIKIDAEGFDPLVLIGAEGLLARRGTEVVIFECHKLWSSAGHNVTLRDVAKLLSIHDFVTFRLGLRYFIPVSPPHFAVSPLDDVTEWGNCAAFRRSSALLEMAPLPPGCPLSLLNQRGGS